MDAMTPEKVPQRLSSRLWADLSGEESDGPDILPLLPPPPAAWAARQTKQRRSRSRQLQHQQQDAFEQQYSLPFEEGFGCGQGGNPCGNGSGGGPGTTGWGASTENEKEPAVEPALAKGPARPPEHVAPGGSRRKRGRPTPPLAPRRVANWRPASFGAPPPLSTGVGRRGSYTSFCEGWAGGGSGLPAAAPRGGRPRIILF